MRSDASAVVLLLAIGVVLVDVADVSAQTCSAGSQTFTSSGTFTLPAGCDTVVVHAWGGGGGGGAFEQAGVNRGGGGGGGGAHARRTISGLTGGSTFTVTVGSGGAGGTWQDNVSWTNGTAGGDSAFGSYLTARGGAGGEAGAAGNAAGGTCIGADVCYAGGNGGAGIASTCGGDYSNGGGGGGGGGTAGAGGHGGNATTNSCTGQPVGGNPGAAGAAGGGAGGRGQYNGAAGAFPGGGGGGGCSASGGCPPGFAGAAGKVTVEYSATGGGSLPAPCTFSDHPVQPGVTTVRAQHLTELRACINALRALRSLAAATWTDPVVTAQQSVIRAVHIAELRTALGGYYTAAGVSVPAWADPSLSSSISVRAVHINELRTHSLNAPLPGCTFALNPASVSATASAQTVTVNVTASSASCARSASSPVSWASVSPASGIGSGTVTIQLLANTGTGPRTATLTVAGLNLPVTQQGQSSGGPDVVIDTFTDVSSTSIGTHVPDLAPGQNRWSTFGACAIRIQNNRLAVPSACGWSGATIESGIANASVRANWWTGSGAEHWGGLVLRYVNPENYVYVAADGDELVVTRVAGELRRVLARMAMPTPASPQLHQFEARLRDRLIEVWFDAEYRFTVYDRAHDPGNTSTRHGVFWNAAGDFDPTDAYDDFRVAGLPAAGPVTFDQQSFTAVTDREDVENTPVFIDVNAAGPSGALITYSATGLPPGLAIDEDGVISGELTHNAADVHYPVVSAVWGTSVARMTWVWTVRCPASNYQVGPAVISAPNELSYLFVNVAAPPECPWIARSESGFVTVEGDGAPRRGVTGFNVTVAGHGDPNPRVGSIAVAGGGVIVSQEGTAQRPCTAATPFLQGPLDVSYGGATIPVVFDSHIQGNNPDSVCGWLARTTSSWIHLAPAGGTPDPNGYESLTITVDRNGGSTERVGYVAINNRVITVQQDEDDCTFTLSRTFTRISAETQQVRDFSMTSGPGCGWSAESLTPNFWLGESGQFLTEWQGTPGVPTEVRIWVENNPQPVARTGRYRIGPYVITIEQDGCCGPPVGDPGGEVSFFHTDALGSVRAVTNVAGDVIASYDYQPFGTQIGNASGTADPQRFTGQERDPGTSAGSEWQVLDYFGARYYQSFTGRFISVDPGHVNGNISDPQSWNGYAYARNNPLTYTDPTGTTYVVCAYGTGEFGGSCGFVSDQRFAQIESNPGSGLQLWNGYIYAGGRAVGYYRQTSIDPTLNDFVRLTGDLSSRWLREQSTQMAVGAAIAATGGLASGAFSGGLATSEALGIGRIAVGVRPSPGQIAQMQQVFARQGRAGVEKALRSLERRLAEHMSKIDSARSTGGYTSSMEREVANFRQLIAAARQVLGK